MAEVAGKQMGDVKHPAYPSVPSPALLRLRAATGVWGQGQSCGAVGQCAQCRVCACCSRLLPASPPSSSCLAPPCPPVGAWPPLESPFPWKTPSHLPGSFGRGPALLCETARVYSRTQHLQRQPCHGALGQLLDTASCSHEQGTVLLPQPPLPVLAPLPPAPCASPAAGPTVSQGLSCEQRHWEQSLCL